MTVRKCFRSFAYRPGGYTSGFASKPQSGCNRAVYRAGTSMERAGVRAARSPYTNLKPATYLRFGGFKPTIMHRAKILARVTLPAANVMRGQCRARAALSGPGSAEGADHVWRIVLSLAGMLIAIAGVVWTLQGLGFIKGSVMTGVTLWVLIGPLIALGGLAVTVTGLRRS
jgi:hypothetical protein